MSNDSVPARRSNIGRTGAITKKRHCRDDLDQEPSFGAES